MSERRQVQLIDSSRLLKRYSWSSYSLSSGWIRFEGGRGRERRLGAEARWVDQNDGTCSYASEWIWERYQGNMDDGSRISRAGSSGNAGGENKALEECSDNMLTEYDVSS